MDLLCAVCGCSTLSRLKLYGQVEHAPQNHIILLFDLILDCHIKAKTSRQWKCAL